MARSISEAEILNGKMVTVFNAHGGVSLGYLVKGEVYRLVGKKEVMKAKEMPFPMVNFKKDGGKAFLDKCRVMAS